MSRSATPATRNEATTRLKPPKMTASAELPIGTAIWSSRGRLRTVANGCDRERNVERTHPQPPDPQSETGTLATHSGKMVIFHGEPLNNQRVGIGLFSDIHANSTQLALAICQTNISIVQLPAWLIKIL